MKRNQLDTIVALATSPGYGGVAVIRVSGPKTKEIAQKLLHITPQERYAEFGCFYSTTGDLIDKGISIYFVAPNSFTGEDVLELHGHGGPVVVDILIQNILELGARLANPGEFSERAFLNGKMDLVQAEAVADLINASSKQAVSSALLSLQGEFSRKIDILVEQTTDLRAKIEAEIDFSEEEIEFVSARDRKKTIEVILHQLKKIKEQAMQGSLLREGVRIAIVGKPNVGKSSLLNYFTGQDSAIVTNIPGTTRDVLRECINLDGLPLHIIDTAGVRETADIIEKEGMRRTLREAEKANFVIFMVDDDNADLELFSSCNISKKTIVVKNKIDLTGETAHIEGDIKIYLSVKTGEGIGLLKDYLKEKIGFHEKAEGIFIARRRHLDALNRVEDFLLRAKEHNSLELIAEELRLGQNALGEITGEVYTEDLLDRIFAEFCIGK